MVKIDKKYAIIFIDYEGESLKDSNFEWNELLSIYYNLPYNDQNIDKSFLQLNCYLIVPKEYFLNQEQIDNFENNDKYTRKFAINVDKIDSFIQEMFPDMNENHGKIELIKGKNRKDSVYQAICKHDELGIKYELIDSFYRNDSMMDTLYKIDQLRARIINEPELKIIFYTHIFNEINIAEKKFKLFIKEENTTNE